MRIGVAHALACALVALACPAFSQTCSSSGPDVIVGDLMGPTNYVNDATRDAFAVGTYSCNIGDAWLDWIADTSQHPVIAQNLYRLKSGKFEQIGMSWLKHGFLSTNWPEAACGNCVTPAHGGDQLGTGCTDTYGAGLNGNRPLGKRSDVNATTAAFPYPYTSSATSIVVD